MRSESRFPARLALVALAALTIGSGSFAAGREGEEESPRITRVAGTVRVDQLPPVLGHPALEGHLETGLTTQLEWRLAVTDGRGRTGGARAVARVRFDLWQEVYVVEWVGEGDSTSSEVGDREQLSAWWRGRSFEARASLAEEATWRIDLRLRVVPYSPVEEEDAREWFSRAPRDREVGGAVGSLLEVVLAGSIRAPELLTRRWRSELEP